MHSKNTSDMILQPFNEMLLQRTSLVGCTNCSKCPDAGMTGCILVLYRAQYRS